MDDNLVGRNVRTLRERSGLSQVELAQRMRDAGHLEFTQQTITRIETGKREVKFEEGLSLAGVLEVAPAALVMRDATESEAVEAVVEASNAAGVVIESWDRVADDFQTLLANQEAAQIKYDNAIALVESAGGLPYDDLLRKMGKTLMATGEKARRMAPLIGLVLGDEGTLSATEHATAKKTNEDGSVEIVEGE